MTEDKIVAFRDPHGSAAAGCIGVIKADDDSEHGRAVYCRRQRVLCAFDLIGARFLREIEPGEGRDRSA